MYIPYTHTIKYIIEIYIYSCSAAKSCPTLCDPMNCSTPDFPALHYLPDNTETHAH